MTADSDKELVLHALAGEAQAFDILAQRCRPWVYGLCFRLVHDRASAEDLVQETLLRAFRDLKRLRDPDRFRPWLSRIALNTCRMHLRRLAARPQELPGAAWAHTSAHSGGDSPFGMDQALAQLGALNRRMLALFYGEGLSHAEVGEVLGLSAAAIKSRLHRVREQLRKEMLGMMTEQQKARLGLAEEQPWALRTILLVEPEDDLRRSLREALTAAGYEVIELPTGEAALAQIAEHRGQMLILDKHCVEPNWIEVLTLVKVDAWSRENVPVIAFGDTAADGRDVLLAWQAGPRSTSLDRRESRRSSTSSTGWRSCGPTIARRMSAPSRTTAINSDCDGTAAGLTPLPFLQYPRCGVQWRTGGDFSLGG